MGFKKNNATSLLSLASFFGVVRFEEYSQKGTFYEWVCSEGKPGCDQGPLASIMTLMKDVLLQPHAFDLNDLYANNFTGRFQDILETTMNKTLIGPKYNITEYRNLYYQLRFPTLALTTPFLPYCMWRDTWGNPPEWGTVQSKQLGPLSKICTLFRPVFTDRGICYSFNGADPKILFHINKTAKYMEAFDQVYGLPSKAYRNDEKYFKANGVGISNGLRIVLDAHTLTGLYKVLPKLDNTFDISVQHPEDFPLPLIEGIKIRGGHRTR